MRLRLSKLIPVRMTSRYGVVATAPDGASTETRERATWWQWRGRVFRHRRVAV